jgi:hypothetical protein
MIKTGNLNWKEALDKLSKLIFEELEPLLDEELWLDHYHPLHDTFLGFLWDPYQVYLWQRGPYYLDKKG